MVAVSIYTRIHLDTFYTISKPLINIKSIWFLIILQELISRCRTSWGQREECVCDNKFFLLSGLSPTSVQVPISPRCCQFYRELLQYLKPSMIRVTSCLLKIFLCVLSLCKCLQSQCRSLYGTAFVVIGVLCEIIQRRVLSLMWCPNFGH